MMTSGKRKIRRIPEFKTREEEAKFWDSHSFTDFLDELKPVRVKVAKNLSLGITIRLDPKTLGRIRVQAQKKGLGPTQLIRMWVLERLDKDGYPATK